MNKYRAELLYDVIDEFIDDEEVYPICVPSYNRPNASFLRFVEKLPIVLFIRREQQDLYSKYRGKCRIVLLDDVEEIGGTRKAIVDWAIKDGESNIFMVDDDINHLSFLLPGVSSKSDKEFMRMYSTTHNVPENIDPKIFKMWVWLINRCDSKLTISAVGAKSDWWNIRYKNSTAIYNSGSTIQCVHLNIENLIEAGINYVDTRVGGTEDYTLQYQVMAAGLHTTIFKDLVYNVPGVGQVSGGNKNTEEICSKYRNFMRLFQENILQVEDEDKVGVKVSKSGIPSIKFHWDKWRQPEGMLYTVDDVLDYYELVRREEHE